MSRPRISAAAGGSVRLNAKFYLAGQAADPYAITQVSIYKQSVREENLIETISIVDPTNSLYPAPIQQGYTLDGTSVDVGSYYLDVDLAIDAYKAGIYYDVWSFIGSEGDLTSVGGGTDGTGTEPDLDESIWKSQCNQFFVTNGDWYVDDELCSLSLGFEQLQNRFNQPERRYIEIGMMPLPLYDFDYKKFMPILPFLTGTITIETQNCEILVNAAPVSIGLRQGSYKSNPFVLKYLLNTTDFLKGTYRFKVTVMMPNGETRTSDYMYITIK